MAPLDAAVSVQQDTCKFADVPAYRRWLLKSAWPGPRRADEQPTAEWYGRLENLWRAADVGLVPFDEEIKRGKYDRSLDPLLSVLQPGSLPSGPYQLRDVHAFVAAFVEHIGREGKLDRYNTSLVVETITRACFSYALPNKASIDAMVGRCSRIVELGAGLGYWAALLAHAGAQVDAFDSQPTIDNRWFAVPQPFEATVRKREMWYPVNQGSVDAIDMQAEGLLLVWPPKEDDLAVQCVEAFSGSTIFYVGEPDGLGGADSSFFDVVRSAPWELDAVIDIPRFPWNEDRLFIYGRRVGAVVGTSR